MKLLGIILVISVGILLTGISLATTFKDGFIFYPCEFCADTCKMPTIICDSCKGDRI